MIPMNRIYIVMYLNSIQPSNVKYTLKQNIYFILLHYFSLRCPTHPLFGEIFCFATKPHRL